MNQLLISLCFERICLVHVMLVRWKTKNVLYLSVILFVTQLLIEDNLLKSPTRRRDCCHPSLVKVEPFARQRQYLLPEYWSGLGEIIEPATTRSAGRAQNNGMSTDNVPSEWRLERPKFHSCRSCWPVTAYCTRRHGTKPKNLWPHKTCLTVTVSHGWAACYFGSLVILFG